MAEISPAHDDWIVPTLGIALALTIAIGIGFLIGQQTPRMPADLWASCRHLPRDGFTANCIALRSTVATEVAASRAFWGNLVSFGALLGTVATLAGLIVTFRQGQSAIRIASDANRIAQNSAQAQARAYLVIERLECKLTLAGSLAIKAAFRNSGQSPARRVTWLSSAIVQTHTEGQADRYLMVGEEPDLSKSHWRQDIAAAESWDTYPLGINFGERDKLAAVIDGATFIAIAIKVVARYEDVFGAPHDEIACFQGRVEPSTEENQWDPLMRSHDNVYAELRAKLEPSAQV